MSHLLHSTFSRVRDYLTPASNISNFAETGQISPEEFVTAGDYLVNKFPTWSWATTSDPKKRTSDLPADKQYLVLKHAPCHTRLEEGFSTWNPDEEEDEVPVTGAAPPEAKTTAPREAAEDSDDDEIPDMDDDDDDDDAVVRKPKGGSKAYVSSLAPLSFISSSSCENSADMILG